MLAELCKELNNWFDRDNRFFETFSIKNGELDLSETGIKNGQYFRIVGSVFNDGVYEYPAALVDETFDGAVWLMSVPEEIISLSLEIDAWKDKYQSIDSPAMSPFNSESFGGYSYSKGSGAANSSAANGSAAGTWQNAFSGRLNQWRKIRP